MARVECDKEEVDLKNEHGVLVRGVRLTCTRCSHTTESFGTSDKSVMRCVILMKEQCREERGENFYEVANAELDGPQYANLVSRGLVPRGREVQSMVRDRPLKPPPRKPRDEQ